MSEDGKGTVKGKAVSRRPTFRREQDFQEVAVSINIDDSPLTEDLHQEKLEHGRIGNEATTVENRDKQNDVPASSEKKDDKPAMIERVVDLDVEIVNSVEKTEDIGEKQESSVEQNETKDVNDGTKADTAQIPHVSEKDAADREGDTRKIDDASPCKDPAEKFKASLSEVKRANSASVRQPQKVDDTADRKPRPLSDLSFVKIGELGSMVLKCLFNNFMQCFLCSLY